MAQNEHTSEQIASYASEILRMEKPFILTEGLWIKIKAIAGSALTQAWDKPKMLPRPSRF